MAVWQGKCLRTKPEILLVWRGCRVREAHPASRGNEVTLVPWGSLELLAKCPLQQPPEEKVSSELERGGRGASSTTLHRACRWRRSRWQGPVWVASGSRHYRAPPWHEVVSHQGCEICRNRAELKLWLPVTAKWRELAGLGMAAAVSRTTMGTVVWWSCLEEPTAPKYPAKCWSNGVECMGRTFLFVSAAKNITSSLSCSTQWWLNFF